MRRIAVALVLFVSMFGFASATTLSDVKARGKLLCGVNSGLLQGVGCGCSG
jgi:hypothetical protein